MIHDYHTLQPRYQSEFQMFISLHDPESCDTYRLPYKPTSLRTSPCISPTGIPAVLWIHSRSVHDEHNTYIDLTRGLSER